MAKYKEQIINTEVDLQLRSVNDKIATFKTKELGLEGIPQHRCVRISLLRGIKVEAYSNRADGTSLSIRLENLPRFIKLPKTKKPVKVRVMAVERLY